MKNLLLLVLALSPSAVFAESVLADSSGGMSQMLLFGVIFIGMYFFMIRPQNKKAKEHQELITKLASGDEVILSSGIVGKIEKVADAFIVLKINDNAELKVQKSSVVALLPKGTFKSI